MQNKQHATSFYIETLILVLVFTISILILTQVFGRARITSAEASDLTRAVRIAENIAESAHAANSYVELTAMMGSSAAVSENMITERFSADMKPSSDGLYEARVSWEGDEGFVLYHISVSRDGKVIYELNTAAGGNG